MSKLYICFRYKREENRETPEIFGKNQFLLNLKFDTEQKRNAGGDMSFLICGPRPGGSFARLSKLFPKMVVFLPNFGDKMPADFQGQAPEF